MDLFSMWTISPSGCYVVYLILCLLILGPFVYPLSICSNDLHLLTIPYHTSSDIGVNRKRSEKKCEVQKGSFLSSRVVSLSFGRFDFRSWHQFDPNHKNDPSNIRANLAYSAHGKD